MMNPDSLLCLIVPLCVGDGREAGTWYATFFGRTADATSDGNYHEWHFGSAHQIHVTERAPAGSQLGRLRFGVEDVEAQRERLLQVGIPVSDIASEGEIHWIDINDPWGNRLGFLSAPELTAAVAPCTGGSQRGG